MKLVLKFRLESVRFVSGKKAVRLLIVDSNGKEIKMLSIFAALLVILSLAVSSFAADHAALSCNQADVDSAKSAMAADPTTPTLIVPPGICPTTRIDLPRTMVLRGYGRDVTTVGSINIGNTGSRVTGFTVTNASTPTNVHLIMAEGQNWRVDNVKCVSATLSNCVWADGRQVGKHPTGLVDHVEGINSRILIYGDGRDDWSEPSTIGVANALGVVTVEDSSFDMTGICASHCANVIDGQSTARYVFRHNTVRNSGAEIHSNQGTRNGRSFEIYNNKFISDRGWFAPMFLRGGTGVVFNNEMSGFSFTMTMDNVRSYEPQYGPLCTAWPCLDQIGSGQQLAGQPQQREPAYFWNNSFNGAPTVPRVSAGPIQEGRDYFNAPRTGYMPTPYPHPLQGVAPLPPTPSVPPTVTINAPVQGQTVSKTIMISVTAK